MILSNLPQFIYRFNLHHTSLGIWEGHYMAYPHAGAPAPHDLPALERDECDLLGEDSQ
jgi:hypothetical protein